MLFPLFAFSAAFSAFSSKSSKRPNILFIIADDWSYPHAGVYGDYAVKTPHFDRIASEGILFEQAYISSPSCTPSRAALLTGQHFWRLKEGANLYGPLRRSFPSYTELLADAGYHVGLTKKGWGPGTMFSRMYNPAGRKYPDFKHFLEAREKDAPFCYWFGSNNPHRGYKKDSGVAAGINLDDIELPACFPESDIIRKDVADYMKEVQDFDAEIAVLLKELEATGELENTLIVVTSDNGMPFPRAKGNLYDLGTRVPLAIKWAAQIKEPARIDAFVSLTDLAPTFLEAAGLSVPKEMTGQSLYPLLQDPEKLDLVEREAVFFGRERHVPGQESGDWGGYPMRAIRTKDFLYIKNFRPDRWPAGTPNYKKATLYPSYYSDVDGGPTRSYMVREKDKDRVHQSRFELAFAKRPAAELYDLSIDPGQLINVAEEPAYEKERKDLDEQLTAELRRTADPRIVGGASILESHPYTGGSPLPIIFNGKASVMPQSKSTIFPLNILIAEQ